MYDVKVYSGNYDKNEFYSVMGKFFAERFYKKIMPYLTNTEKKIWYLFYSKNELVGFFGIEESVLNTNFMDMYIVDGNDRNDILNFMCNYVFNIYKNRSIKILTSNEDEIKVWQKLGFESIKTKGRYQMLTWVNDNE